MEFNASSRAVRLLDETGILSGEEVGYTKNVLGAAALTYVAAAAGSILQLLRLLITVWRKKMTVKETGAAGDHPGYSAGSTEKGKYSHVILSQALAEIPIPGKTGPLLHQACGGRDGRVPDSARLYIKFIFESKSK